MLVGVQRRAKEEALLFSWTVICRTRLKLSRRWLENGGRDLMSFMRYGEASLPIF
jgi:hypothetical protein